MKFAVISENVAVVYQYNKHHQYFVTHKQPLRHRIVH